MKRKIIRFILTLIFLSYSFGICCAEYRPLLSDSSADSHREKYRQMKDELAFLTELLKSDILEELANPKMSSQEDMDRRFGECAIIERRLNRLIDVLRSGKVNSMSPESYDILTIAIHVREMAANYSVFAKGWSDERIFRIDLDEKKERGISLKIPKLDRQDDRKRVYDSACAVYHSTVQVWKKHGLEIPPGYIYVKIFPSDKSMEEWFNLENKKIAGLTIPCRFVAIPWRKSSSEFENTLSHELVHAFVGSQVGYFMSANLPKWWHEGLATFLSDDLGSQLLEYSVKLDEKGNLLTHTLESHTDDEYMLFKARFEYLLSTYGQERMATFIKTSLQSDSDIDQALKKVYGITAPDKFFESAKNWRKNWDYRNYTLLIAILVVWVGTLLIAISSRLVYCIHCIFFGVIILIIVSYYPHSINYTKYLAITLGTMVCFLIYTRISLHIRTQRDREKRFRRTVRVQRSSL